jgi:hypothetical protein
VNLPLQGCGSRETLGARMSSQKARRGCLKSGKTVIARSAATKQSLYSHLDCFALLAMIEMRSFETASGRKKYQLNKSTKTFDLSTFLFTFAICFLKKS